MVFLTLIQRWQPGGAPADQRQRQRRSIPGNAKEIGNGYEKHFDRFLAEASTTDRETDGGLDKEELYGLYTSWCLLNDFQPEPAEALWEALKGRRINTDDNTLAMSGPAALDYIVKQLPRPGAERPTASRLRGYAAPGSVRARDKVRLW